MRDIVYLREISEEWCWGDVLCWQSFGLCGWRGIEGILSIVKGEELDHMGEGSLFGINMGFYLLLFLRSFLFT